MEAVVESASLVQCARREGCTGTVCNYAERLWPWAATRNLHDVFMGLERSFSRPLTSPCILRRKFWSSVGTRTLKESRCRENEQVKSLETTTTTTTTILTWQRVADWISAHCGLLTRDELEMTKLRGEICLSPKWHTEVFHCIIN